MDEKSLYNLSLFCFLIGLFLILIVSEKMEIPEDNINNLNFSSEEQKVKIKGSVYNIKNTDNLIIFHLKDQTGNITIIAFNSGNLSINQNDIVEVEGKLILYKGKSEIEASKIKIF